MIAYVLPTHNRPKVLSRTLDALAALPAHSAEVIIVDNASRPPPHAPVELPNGLPVTLVMRGTNEGAAARNAGVRASDPSCEWIVMLDDDSHPLDLNFLDALDEQPSDVAAVAAEIFLGGGIEGSGDQGIMGKTRRESGGLPEVFTGCGVAIRREAFLQENGYDDRFHFYAEEYDLAARFLLAGSRIVMDRRFRVLHEKTSANRSMDTILRRLVRNNAWVMQRYAPASARRTELRRTLVRYGRISLKERAEVGYAMGLTDLALSLHRQPRREMDDFTWDRFTGKAACRRSLLAEWSARRFQSASIVAPGKNEHIVRECLNELGVSITADVDAAEALVIGTLSPGPMLDAVDMLGSEQRVIAPWNAIVDNSPRTAATKAPRSQAA